LVGVSCIYAGDLPEEKCTFESILGNPDNSDLFTVIISSSQLFCLENLMCPAVAVKLELVLPHS
jgi:hypothetical protein